MTGARLDAGDEVALRGLATAPALTLCQRLDTSPRGLTETEAAERWTPAEDRAEPTASARLRSAVLSQFVLLLAGLAAVFAALGDARGWVTIAVMVAVSVGLRWWLRTRSDREVRRLRSRVTRTASVRRRGAGGRPGRWREIPVADLVPDVIVKRLDSIQDLGGMDVLCLDKTGALTEDRVVFAHSIDLDGQLDDTAAEYAYVMSRLACGPPDRFDRAVVDYVTEDEALLAQAMYTKLDELGFDHDRRRSSVVVRDAAGDRMLITMGDPEEVLPLCTRYALDEGDARLRAAQRRGARDCVAAHEAHGMRVLAVAARTADLGDRGDGGEHGDRERT